MTKICELFIQHTVYSALRHTLPTFCTPFLSSFPASFLLFTVPLHPCILSGSVPLLSPVFSLFFTVYIFAFSSHTILDSSLRPVSPSSPLTPVAYPSPPSLPTHTICSLSSSQSHPFFPPFAHLPGVAHYSFKLFSLTDGRARYCGRQP